MKTAISIPNPLYERAEEIAHKKGISRSELYTTAIQEYVEKHDDDFITEELNRVYAKEYSSADPALLESVLHAWSDQDETEEW